MRSTVTKRSVVLSGRPTSVSLEDAFRQELRKIARARQVPTRTLVEEIRQQKRLTNLSSALRVFVLTDLRARAT